MRRNLPQEPSAFHPSHRTQRPKKRSDIAVVADRCQRPNWLSYGIDALIEAGSVDFLDCQQLSTAAVTSAPRDIVFLTTANPFPPDDGQKIPVANYFLTAEAAGVQPHLLILKRRPRERSFWRRIRTMSRRLSPFHGYHVPEVLDEEAAGRLRNLGAAIVFVMPARMSSHIPALRHLNPELRIVLLLNDAQWPQYREALLFGLGLRRGGGWIDLAKGMLTPITILKEVHAYRGADCVVVQTERERRRLPWLTDRLVVATNAIPAPSVGWHGFDSTTLVAQVNFANRRRDRLAAFVRRVWPQIRARHPWLALELFGPGSEAAPSWTQTDGISVAGYVDDIDSYLAAKRGMVMPLEHDTGVSNTILRGLAINMPMAISKSGSLGVSELIKGDDRVFVADCEGDYPAAIDKAIAVREATSGRAIGSWPDNFRRILDMLEA